MFAITGFYKYTEQDDLNNGRIGNSADYFIDYAIKTDTLDEMKTRIADFLRCKVEALELDACEEVGRIESGHTENAGGNEANESELASWRKGETVLYYAVYSAYVMECMPVSVA